MRNSADGSGYDLHNVREASNFDQGLKVLGLANVGCLVDFPGSTVVHPGLEPFYRGPDMTVFRNKYAGARAAFFDRYAYFSMGDWQDYGRKDNFLVPLLASVKQGAFLDKGALMVNDVPAETFPPAAATGAARSTVAIQESAPDRVRVEVSADRPGLLFLADTMFPGWVAYRNGVKVAILRSWLNFRAVQVPAGKSVVEFFYRPLVLLSALALSAATALAWLVLFRRFRNSPPPAPPAPAAMKKKKKTVESSATPDSDAALTGLCGAAAEAIVLPMAGATLLFWTLWAAARYEGGILRGWSGAGFAVNAAACALLGFGAAALLRDRTRRRAPSSTPVTPP
jgi:hypothetical protein